MRGIMKKFAVLMLALASLGAMTGCDDDDDSVKVPAAVQDTFGRMFPGAGHVEWAGKQGYLVAEFREGGTDMQAWFDAAGKWYMTEEDVPYALLPQAVRTAFESGEYAAWHVDDADKLTREGLETVYVLEVEQRDAEYELVYSEDGVLLRAVPDADGDRDHGDMLPQELPQAVKDFIGRKYRAPASSMRSVKKADSKSKLSTAVRRARFISAPATLGSGPKPKCAGARSPQR